MSRTLVAALVAASTLLPTAAMANVVWKGDFSTGDLSQWAGKQAVSDDRLQVQPADQNPSGQKNMLRVLVKQGDNPISASGNRNEVLNPTYIPEGSEYYYRWQTKFDQSFPSEHTWQLFTQWHQKADFGGSPPIQFYVDGEQIILTETLAETVVWTTPLVRGQWHDFVLHVKFSDDAKVGFLELWYDGQHVLDKTYGATLANDYLKMGLYRNSTVSEDGIVYHTGMVQGETYEDVVPPAPAPGPTADNTNTNPASGTSSSGATTTPPPTSGTATAGVGLGGSTDSGTGQTKTGCSTTGGPLTLAGLLLGVMALTRRRPLARAAVQAKK